MLLGRERNLGSYPSPVHQTKHDQDQTTEILAPPTAAQMKEVDEAFALFDTRKAGTLDLYEVKVRAPKRLDYTVRNSSCRHLRHKRGTGAAVLDSEVKYDAYNLRDRYPRSMKSQLPGPRLLDGQGMASSTHNDDGYCRIF